MNGLITIETFEHLIDGIVVSHKVTKFCGIPLYSTHVESSNYNWVGQFDAQNFTRNQEEKKDIPLYTETHIGFANEENTKESSQETTEQSYKRKTNI